MKKVVLFSMVVGVLSSVSSFADSFCCECPLFTPKHNSNAHTVRYELSTEQLALINGEWSKHLTCAIDGQTAVISACYPRNFFSLLCSSEDGTKYENEMDNSTKGY